MAHVLSATRREVPFSHGCLQPLFADRHQCRSRQNGDSHQPASFDASIQARTGVEGVNSAIEIQAALKAENANLPPKRRMEFRIVVNSGDVMVEGDQIYGDEVPPVIHG